MGRLSIALLNTAPPNALGSMAAYGDLVHEALAVHAPQFDLVPVNLRDSASASTSNWWRRSHMLLETARGRLRCRRVRASIYHVLDGSFGYMIGGIPWERTLITVHDLIPALQARGRFPAPPLSVAARQLIQADLAAIKRCGAVHAVSRSTADDILELTGRTADAVILNPQRSLPGTPSGRASSAGGVKTPFVLHVGNNSFYKNRRGVLEVFARVAAERPDVQLVLAGPEPDRNIRTLVSAYRLEARVFFEVDPTDGRLAELYQDAALFLFPSLYEGFGWPPLEAARYGCPVVCSRVASLPEVVGDAALLCDPHDVAAFAAAVLRLLSDLRLVDELAARGRRNLSRFTLRQLADGLSRLYETTVGRA